MLVDDTRTRDALSRLFRKNVDEVVSDHVRRGTQEPAITSKIGDRLEYVLNGRTINGYAISVIAQDLSDRGRSSQESRTGADLLIGIRVQNPAKNFDFSKGLLIQAKKTSGWSSADQARLIEQCEKLLNQSAGGSYVWIYDSSGARAVPASEVLAMNATPIQKLASKGISMHFRDIFDCVAGDVELADNHMFEGPDQLKEAMEELSARSAVAISLRKPP